MHKTIALTAAFALTFHGQAAAETFRASPGDDVETIINGLGPGDELELAGGVYEIANSDRFLITLRGSEAQPIAIRSRGGERAHFRRNGAAQNLWDLDVEHVLLQDLEFSGGSAGLRFLHARHVTIEGCEIHDTADVALRMNDGEQTYEENLILRNDIHDTSGTGEGMYLGCTGIRCRFIHNIVAENHVHDTDGPGVSQGDGIELKRGAFDNIVRDNVVHDTNFPCILTYANDREGEAPNRVEGNLVYNCGDHGLQIGGDAVVENNIVLGAGNVGIAMQSHDGGDPRALFVRHNTVINVGDAMALRGQTGTVVIANNALYSQSGRALFVRDASPPPSVEGNAAQGSVQGASVSITGSIRADFVMGSFGGAPPMVLYPAEGGALVGAGEMAERIMLDFDHRERAVADIGAYRFVAGETAGWALAPEIKSPPASPMPDGGTPLSDAGARDAGAEAMDGGSPRDDAGSRADAGNMHDAATTADGGADDSEGGCAASDGPTPLSAGLLLLLALRVQRRRPRG